MRWYDVACIIVFFIGLVLFLYGANYYDAFAGWTGVVLVAGAFFAEIFLKIYEILSKHGK